MMRSEPWPRNCSALDPVLKRLPLRTDEFQIWEAFRRRSVRNQIGLSVICFLVVFVRLSKHQNDTVPRNRPGRLPYNSLPILVKKLPTVACLISHMRVTSSIYLILLHFITIIILAYECILWNSSLRNFLSLPVTSCLLGPSTFISTLYLDTFIVCYFLKLGAKLPSHKKTTVKIIV